MTSSSQQHCRSGRYYHGIGHVHCNHLPYWYRRPKTDDLKVSVNSELTTISKRELSIVHQKMKTVSHKPVEINCQIRKGGLHSILFDNISNKAENQILGVILDACNHFVRKNSRNSRYITFSSGLNKLKSQHSSHNESCETGICDSGHGNFSGFRLKKKYNFCLVALLALALCFFVSCGGGSSKPANESGGDSVSNFGKLGQECYPNKSCDGELTCDEETNRCIEDPENPVNDSDTGKPSENNDSDKPVEHNDNDDNPIEHNDTDNPIEDHNDIDDINDTDPIENNDGEPAEITDNDIQSDECAKEDIVFTASQLEAFSPEYQQEYINHLHDTNRVYCPGSLIEKDRYDTKGNLCVEDECNIGPNDIAPGGDSLWIDNIPLLVWKETGPDGLPPPYDTIYHRKVELLNSGSPTDLTIKIRLMTIYADSIPTASCFSPNNIVDNVSTITMSIGNGYYNGCYFGDQQVSQSDIISTKNIQPKIVESDFMKACEKVPNSGYYSNKRCLTTVTEFAWLENVVKYLYSKSGLNLYNTKAINTKIEKDVDNNVFRMYFSIYGEYTWAVELPNAKRCLDECYGIEGCEVSIKPNPDLSNGCIVKEPENASLMRPNTKNKTPLMAKQKNYARVDMKKLPKRNLAVSPR